jgi:hypothetical protein
MRAVPVSLLVCGLLAAQVPRISVIDFYGVHKVPEGKLLSALRARVGDSLPASKAEAEDRLARVDGVVDARLEAVCCEAGGAMLFVGIEEKGAPHFETHAAPATYRLLPDEIVDTYRAFLDRYEQSVRSGEDRENLTRGYALAADPEVRGYQERFVGLAEENLAVIDRVLRDSTEADQRTMAAYVIGYAPDKRAAVETLLYALRDPEEAVRQTALRALSAVAVYASQNPKAGVRIAPTWAIEMLHSIVWSDRTQATRFLVILTEKRDDSTLQQLRDRALSSLVEMAKWNSLRYALPAYILLGRIAGMTEDQIQSTWSKGEREQLTSKFASPGESAK